ncbi:MAG: hypothetical protein LBR37_04460 [Erysipelotrichaceae bacterium]|jgi:hypothetical protein|nr:hypothetical protein [Erysipelotrichaceae bacterium]
MKKILFTMLVSCFSLISTNSSVRGEAVDEVDDIETFQEVEFERKNANVPITPTGTTTGADQYESNDSPSIATKIKDIDSIPLSTVNYSFTVRATLDSFFGI